MDKKDSIEIDIYLRVELEKEKSLQSSFQAHLKDGKNLEEITVKTDDKELKSILDKLPISEQIKVLQDKHLEIIKENKLKRIKKAKKVKIKLSFINEKNIINFNEDTGILKVKLTKSEIEKLSKNNKDIYLVRLPSIKKPTQESAISNTHLNTTVFPFSSYGGDGVGIFMNEAFDNCFEESKVTPIETLIGLGGGDYTEDRPESDHANKVAQSLRASSPESHIYCSDETYSLPSSWEDSIHIVNYSWSADSQSTEFTIHDKVTDTFAYNNNIQVFVSSGNGCNDKSNSTDGCEVIAPGKSHNALTVGAYDDTTNQMANYSNWINPDTGAIKPEILAPGGGTSLLTFAGTLEPARGTSFASPFAAGMAASNISLMSSSMKKHAGLIKASMLAMATKDNISDYEDSKRNEATGIQWNPDGWYFWLEQPNSYLNSADGAWVHIVTSSLPANRDAKIALSWLNHPSVCDGSVADYTYTGVPSNHLCMDFALAVVNSSNTVTVLEHSLNQNWEAAEFNTGDGGNHYVYIWRVRNYYESIGDIDLKNNIKMGIRLAYIDNKNEDEN